jgi:hypothetical protein
MSDFNVRSDSVNVEQIMEQVRDRIREKRGVDYTEQQIRELAALKLEKFLDPRGVRSDLLKEFRGVEPDPNFAFEEDTLFHSTRAPFLMWIRRLLRPVLKLFFNPNPLINVLHTQSKLNALNASRHQLYYELIHNLVVEATRLGIEVRNLKMRVESMDARVDFSERRARALEGAVMYRPQVEDEQEATRPSPSRSPAPSPIPPPERAPSRPVFSPSPAAQIGSSGSAGTGGPGPGPGAESSGQRSKRRRRRRGRRGGAPAASIMGVPSGMGSPAGSPQGVAPPASDAPDSDAPAPPADSGAERDAGGQGPSTPLAKSPEAQGGGSGHGGADDEQ